MLNLFTKHLEWLFKGIRLQDPELPTQLDTDAVVAVLDVFQGGAAHAEFFEFIDNTGVSFPGGDRTVIAPNPDFQHRVWNLCIFRGGGAGNAVVNIQYAPPFVSAQHHVRWLRFLPNDDMAAIGEMLTPTALISQGGVMGTSQHPWFIPPNWGLVINFPSTGVAENFQTQALIERRPRGWGW